MAKFDEVFTCFLSLIFSNTVRFKYHDFNQSQRRYSFSYDYDVPLWFDVTALGSKDLDDFLSGKIELPSVIAEFIRKEPFFGTMGLIFPLGVYKMRDVSRKTKYLVSILLPSGEKGIVVIAYKGLSRKFVGKEYYRCDVSILHGHFDCDIGGPTTVEFFDYFQKAHRAVKCLLNANQIERTPLDLVIRRYVPERVRRLMDGEAPGALVLEELNLNVENDEEIYMSDVSDEDFDFDQF